MTENSVLLNKALSLLEGEHLIILFSTPEARLSKRVSLAKAAKKLPPELRGMLSFSSVEVEGKFALRIERKKKGEADWRENIFIITEEGEKVEKVTLSEEGEAAEKGINTAAALTNRTSSLLENEALEEVDE